MSVTNSTAHKTTSFAEPLKQVIEQAKSGNEQAMHQLYKLYGRAMLNTAFRILNNAEDAEDVLQESFINIFTKLNQYNYQSSFGAWVKRIVVNRSIDELKKKRRKSLLNDENGVPVTEIETFNSNGEVDQKVQLDLLYKALHALPDGYRTVFSLYMLEGYDHHEISEILDIGVSTSISQLSRAKQKLRSLTVKFQHHG
ncbi:MAG: RNA polymerase sigma factor [Bacteroidetes bacterium]|nr:MAG: RNA polymerase sigma factor [Bacteroidota bacterium]